MQDLVNLIRKAQQGDLSAFDLLIQRFRDMAVGYAYSILGDFHLAEDAAQEAFVQAYRDLKTLRNPQAFGAWFRRIVFKYCSNPATDASFLGLSSIFQVRRIYR